MNPGPDRIVACPHCRGLARHETITSGNSIGRVAWTDGFEKLPMLPSPPPVVQCAHCSTAYWLGDAAEVEWRARGERDPDGSSVGKAVEPTEEEYYEAIARGLATNGLEDEDLRLLAWWRSNDAFRTYARGEVAGNVETAVRCRENLEALLPLLDDGRESAALLRAEVLRELGRFDEAKACAARITSRAWVGEVRQLARLCDAGNTRVQRREEEEATCPRCGGELRTPYARQCRFCGADWH